MRLTIGDLARLAGVSPRTLRHYDDVGLFRPSTVDRATGYRYYDLARLAELRRILVLRELGLGVEQIRAVFADGEPSVEQLAGMLRLRRAEIEEQVASEQQRLRRIEAQLHALEPGDTMRTVDITTITAPAIRVLETTGVAPGHGPLNIGPIFATRLPIAYESVVAQGGTPGKCVAHYDPPADDGSMVVHLGFDIGDQPVADRGETRVVELPAVEVATALHLGPIEDITDTFEAIVRWLDTMGYGLAPGARELYHVWDENDPTKNVTEVQLPFSR